MQENNNNSQGEKKPSAQWTSSMQCEECEKPPKDYTHLF